MRPLHIIALGLALSSAAVHAQAPVAVGATVYDTEGGVVGTVDSVTADALVVATGKNKVALPRTSFGAGDKGPLLAMTRIQLDAAAEGAAAAAQAKAKAELAAALVPGTMVHGSSGAMLGTVKAVAGETVTVTTPKGDVGVPAGGLSVGGPGMLILGMSSADFDAAVAAATAAAPQ